VAFISFGIIRRGVAWRQTPPLPRLIFVVFPFPPPSQANVDQPFLFLDPPFARSSDLFSAEPAESRHFSFPQGPEALSSQLRLATVDLYCSPRTPPRTPSPPPLLRSFFLPPRDSIRDEFFPSCPFPDGFFTDLPTTGMLTSWRFGGR